MTWDTFNQIKKRTPLLQPKLMGGGPMNRRSAIGALLALATLPLSLQTKAQATQPGKRFRIGMLPDFGPVTRGHFVSAMRDLGWIVGNHFIIVPSGEGGTRGDDEEFNCIR